MRGCVIIDTVQYAARTCSYVTALTTPRITSSNRCVPMSTVETHGGEEEGVSRKRKKVGTAGKGSGVQAEGTIGVEWGVARETRDRRRQNVLTRGRGMWWRRRTRSWTFTTHDSLSKMTCSVLSIFHSSKREKEGRTAGRGGAGWGAGRVLAAAVAEGRARVREIQRQPVKRAAGQKISSISGFLVRLI